MITNKNKNANANTNAFFDDPELGKIPVIALKTITVNEFQALNFEPFEVTKMESEFRFKRNNNLVTIYKRA